MTEKEYIDACDLAKLRIIDSIARTIQGDIGWPFGEMISAVSGRICELEQRVSCDDQRD